MENKTGNIFYPSGGILLWILIFLELLTFGISLFAMFWFAREESQVFINSVKSLNQNLGTLNTLILLTSGFFVAEAVGLFKEQKRLKSRNYLVLAILSGILFLLVKSLEYREKISLGISLQTNTFFTFYFLLTGFHFIHVLVGIFLLAGVTWKMKTSLSLEDLEAAAAFWHMCDLIWLILFPSLYLIL